MNDKKPNTLTEEEQRKIAKKGFLDIVNVLKMHGYSEPEIFSLPEKTIDLYISIWQAGATSSLEILKNRMGGKIT